VSWKPRKHINACTPGQPPLRHLGGDQVIEALDALALAWVMARNIPPARPSAAGNGSTSSRR